MPSYELMKNANVYGTFVGHDRKPAGILDYHQKEVALPRPCAGPGEKRDEVQRLIRVHPGNSAGCMFQERNTDVPLDAD